MPRPDPEAVAEAVFAALAEPTRRSILSALAARGPTTATGLADLLPISRQAITKHLELLSAAGLVLAEPGERRRIRYRVNAPLPLIPAYSISKAAAFNLTQSLRALLAERGVRVHAVLTGPTDTDMTRGLYIPKASAESVARAIFDGVENGEEDIFPDPMSQSLADSWRSGATKALERQLSAFVAAEPVKA